MLLVLRFESDTRVLQTLAPTQSCWLKETELTAYGADSSRNALAMAPMTTEPPQIS